MLASTRCLAAKQCSSNSRITASIKWWSSSSSGLRATRVCRLCTTRFRKYAFKTWNNPWECFSRCIKTLGCSRCSPRNRSSSARRQLTFVSLKLSISSRLWSLCRVTTKRNSTVTAPCKVACVFSTSSFTSDARPTSKKWLKLQASLPRRSLTWKRWTAFSHRKSNSTL